ncbi:hypothetical protein IHE39_09040 [Aminobacter carboxidus]|uniref:Uncharacterized protein n=1 Tax=Aminobacter carboxidus TaxID=376165 RepID=A0ABR9GLD8_9HYPH|nr:hypothetical protein [Aminobacter carboxidus]
MLTFRSSHPFADYFQWQMTLVVESIVAIPGGGQTLAPAPLFNHVSAMAICHLLATRAIKRSGAAGRIRLRGIETIGDTLEEL